MLYVNLHPDGALIEDAPASEAAVELKLSERADKTLSALMNLGSYELSLALAQVWLAGVKEGHRTTRRHPATS